MSNITTYLLNSPVIGFIDSALQKQDVTPLIVTMPSSWSQAKTRWRVRLAGTFQLPNVGDLFFRKFWIGKTQITQCSSQSIRPGEARYFADEHTILFYGDNLHAVQSVHHTGLVSCGAWAGQTVPGGITGTNTQFGGALPATSELSMIDAPLIIDDNWNNVSPSFFCALAKDGKVAFSVRECSVERCEV
jgi:hypothetical protein